MPHTPGPWVNPPMDAFSLLRGADGSNILIDDAMWHNENREADLALIAAAPDLLEGCVLALETLDSIQRSHRQLESQKQKKLRAAIAKARGEA